MNQDFVFQKYRVSTAVYPVGMARGAEGTLAPRPDRPSLLSAGRWGREPRLSLSCPPPGLRLPNSLLAPPVASRTAPPEASPMTAILVDCPALTGLAPLASHSFPPWAATWSVLQQQHDHVIPWLQTVRGSHCPRHRVRP